MTPKPNDSVAENPNPPPAAGGNTIGMTEDEAIKVLQNALDVEAKDGGPRE